MPVALCAMGLLAFVFSGCRKQEEAPAVDPSSPVSYMNDKTFRDKLSAGRREQLDLLRERNAVAEKMKAMIDAKKAELKTSDPERLKAALDGDAAWQELYVKCTNANAKVAAQRRKVQSTVRDRLRPQEKSVSK